MDLNEPKDLRPDHNDVAFLPYCEAIKKDTIRFGISSRGMSGVGCFLFSARACEFEVCMLDVAHIMAEFPDLNTFDDLETKLSEKKLTSHDFEMAIVGEGESVWIPYGFIPLVTGVPAMTTLS